MGRAKLQIKRIENVSARNVTFGKRRTGIVKKAYELSVLCDGDVGLLIFASNGKLTQYCNRNIEEVLLRFANISQIDREKSALDTRNRCEKLELDERNEYCGASSSVPSRDSEKDQMIFNQQSGLINIPASGSNSFAGNVNFQANFSMPCDNHILHLQQRLDFFKDVAGRYFQFESLPLDENIQHLNMEELRRVEAQLLDSIQKLHDRKAHVIYRMTHFSMQQNQPNILRENDSCNVPLNIAIANEQYMVSSNWPEQQSQFSGM